MDKDPDIMSKHGEDVILAVAVTAASLSLFASLVVLISYFFILWYQASMVNRVSLRLIIFSCMCNIIFSAMGLGAVGIGDTSTACRVIIYFIVATDVMSVTCLSMIGLNLVMILIVRVTHPQKMEKYYYAFIALLGAIAIVIPLASRAPPAIPVGKSCWIHYYYTGRMTRIFKWMWYYGCLLFASILAFVCSAMTIAKFVRQQDFFAGTIDMARGDAAHIESAVAQRTMRPGQKTTVVFRKVILRCMCYPLIPIISKGCSVGIQIAAIVDDYVPMESLAADACLANLLGFFISCIYFTDPSVVTVGREIAKRIKRRYVDDYFPAAPLTKPPIAPIRRLSGASSRGSRRFFSADDASTISRLSSREDLRLSLSGSSRNTSIHSQSDEARANSQGILMVTKKKTTKELVGEHHTSVTLALLAQAKEAAARDAAARDAAEAATGIPVHRRRRYTYPHIDVQDPHGRLADLVGRVGAEVHSIASSDSTIQQQKGAETLILAAFYTFFPCMMSEEERERRMSMMPMHRVTDSSSQKRAIGSLTLDEFWAMDMVPQGGRIPRTSDAMRSGSIISMPHPAARNENVQVVEPYKYPILAMMTHWVLIKVFRLKPPAAQEDHDEMEMVDITTGSSTSISPQKSKEQSESPPQSEQGSDIDDSPSGFFRRTSIRAVDFASPDSGTSDNGRRHQLPAFSPTGNTPDSSRNEDYFLRPDTFDASSSSDDPKGKRPMFQRLRSFDREPLFFNLKPGKDISSRKSAKSGTSSNSKTHDQGEKFVLTVTDTANNTPQHEEILPVHPTDTSASQPTSRPGIFRRVSDMPPWSKSPFAFHVLGRGPSPSKSIRIAKHFAERVGDGSIIRSRQRRNTTSPPLTTRDSSIEGLSPPPSIPPSPPSTVGAPSMIYAFPLEARPQHTYRKRHDSVGTVAAQVHVRSSLLLDDFGTDHTVDSTQVLRSKLSKETRQAIQASNDIEDGFSYGVARVITVRNWEESEIERVIIHEGSWDIELLMQQEMDQSK